MKHIEIDLPLLIIILLLATSLTAFFAGLFPYPFGLVILVAALLGRILYIRSSP